MFSCVCGAIQSRMKMLRGILVGIAVAIIAAVSGGCTSAVVQTPTLSFMEPNLGGGSKENHMFPNDDTDLEAMPSHFYLHPLPIDITKTYRTNATKDRRNEVQNELFRRSDQICSAYQTRLIHGYVVGDASIKASQSLLGIAKTLAAPFEILSTAIGGFSTGVTNVISGDILQWKLFEETNKRILYSRRNFRNTVRAAQEKPLSKYSISQAIYDAERYHALCNFPTALVGGDDLIAKSETEQILPPPPLALASAPQKDPPKAAPNK